MSSPSGSWSPTLFPQYYIVDNINNLNESWSFAPCESGTGPFCDRWPPYPSIAYLRDPKPNIFLHPDSDHDVIIRWTSPVAAEVSLSGELVSDQPLCGNPGFADGVHWELRKNGNLRVGGDFAFGGRVRMARKARYEMDAGDYLDFVIGARGNANCDRVRFSVNISSRSQ